MNIDYDFNLLAYEKVSLSNELTSKEIRSLVKTETSLPVRRMDTFTLISLLAVHRLLNNPSIRSTLSDKLSLYSAAEYLSVDLFQSVLTSMHNNESIRPFDFIATVGNAANFYIAKEFTIKGPNIFIGASEKPFLKSCILAEIDFLEGHSSQAIIIVWSVTNTTQECYAFIIGKSVIDNSAVELNDLSNNNEELLNIDTFINKGLSIPTPCRINNVF